jgi:nitrate reductase gamma subunit
MRDLTNSLVFGWYPYFVLTVFLLGSWLRFDRVQHSWPSGRSGILHDRQLMWGVALALGGILTLFAGHFVGLLTPIWVFDAIGISHNFKQWMAIAIGGAAGVVGFVGISLLVGRLLLDARLRASAAFADGAMLLMIYAQLTLGLPASRSRSNTSTAARG